MDVFRLAADAVLVLHASFVAFVVIGQLLIVAGLLAGQAWVRHFGFRLAHTLAIGIVVLQAWLGVLCPLTVLENGLRARAGLAGYPDSFVSFWLHRLIFFDAPSWVFTLAYSLFGLSVLAAWYWGPPRRAR